MSSIRPYSPIPAEKQEKLDQVLSMISDTRVVLQSVLDPEAERELHSKVGRILNPLWYSVSMQNQGYLMRQVFRYTSVLTIETSQLGYIRTRNIGGGIVYGSCARVPATHVVIESTDLQFLARIRGFDTAFLGFLRECNRKDTYGEREVAGLTAIARASNVVLVTHFWEDGDPPRYEIKGYHVFYPDGSINVIDERDGKLVLKDM